LHFHRGGPFIAGGGATYIVAQASIPSHNDPSYAKLEASVAQALEWGSTDVAAIRHLLMTDQLQHGVRETIEIGALAAYERPMPSMAEYSQLLSVGMIEVQA
jgi:hypothetical protein